MMAFDLLFDGFPSLTCTAQRCKNRTKLHYLINVCVNMKADSKESFLSVYEPSSNDWHCFFWGDACVDIS